MKHYFEIIECYTFFLCQIPMFIFTHNTNEGTCMNGSCPVGYEKLSHCPCSVHQPAHGNVAPVCECWAPEFSVCTQRGALVLGKIRWPWSDIKVLMSSVAPQCDLVTAKLQGDLEMLHSFKGQIPHIVLHSLGIRRTFSAIADYELILSGNFASLFEWALHMICIKHPVTICLPQVM